MVAQQAEMEEIISSIRTTLAEETAKVGGSNADLIDAAAAEDDVLELTASEMVEASGTVSAVAPEGLVDINAFASTGEAKPAQVAEALAVDLLGEPLPVQVEAAPVSAPVAFEPEPVVAVAEVAAEAPKGGEAADEFDRLLAQISSEQKQQVAVAEEQKQALLAEEEPLGELPVLKSPSVEAGAALAVEDVAVQPAAQVLHDVPMMAASVSGNQVTLPAEVLAMALRPMVQDWLRQNLAGVVEKLVKDELAKMAQG